MKILFVCTGNACRSPFAEHLMRRLSPVDLQVDSAGTHAYPGLGPSWLALVSARAHGLDLGEHRRRPLDPHLLRSADRIYAFDRYHAEYLRTGFPSVAARVSLLAEIAAGPGGEIPDPMGGSQEDVDIC